MSDKIPELAPSDSPFPANPRFTVRFDPLDRCWDVLEDGKAQYFNITEKGANDFAFDRNLESYGREIVAELLALRKLHKP